MQVYTITSADKGQRLDKYIKRRLPFAPSSFVYKMLRKKNITLNGGKASGSEIVAEGDEVRLFLSDDTIISFGGAGKTDPAYPAENLLEARQAFRQLSRRYPELRLVYEDNDIAAAFKPAGVLSQKAKNGDLSLNEWFLGLLLDRNEITEHTLVMFVPSVQNRLDRNTEGIVLLAKTLQGSHFLTGLQREHRLQKYYQMIVTGSLDQPGVIEGWLSKDRTLNTVHVLPEQAPGTVYTRTEYVPLGEKRLPRSAGKTSDGTLTVTFVDAHLITGKTHQLRAHFASIRHPILGDPKYGDPSANRWCQEHGITRQLLISQRVVFPEKIEGDFSYLSGKMIQCPLPGIYEKVMTSDL